MIARLYIKQLIEMLDCKNTRGVKNWCIKNGIAVLSDIGSNKKYVIKAEFEVKYEIQSIRYIQQKYGADKLEEILKGDMRFIYLHQQIQNRKAKEYKPQGTHEKRFLSMLQKNSPEL